MRDKVRYDDIRWNCAVSKPFHSLSNIFIGWDEDVSMNDDVSDDDGSIRVLVRISISFSHHLSSICSFLHRFYSLSLSLFLWWAETGTVQWPGHYFVTGGMGLSTSISNYGASEMHIRTILWIQPQSMGVDMSHIPSSPNVSLFWLCPLAYRVSRRDNTSVNLYVLLFPSLVSRYSIFRRVSIIFFLRLPIDSKRWLEENLAFPLLLSRSRYQIRARKGVRFRSSCRIVARNLEEKEKERKRKERKNNKYRSLFDRATSNR